MGRAVKETPGRRKTRLSVLGPNTARCSKCLADCTATVGEWVLSGLCPKCENGDPTPSFAELDHRYRPRPWR